MSDPKLTKANVQLGYSSDDGYQTQTVFSTRHNGGDPKAAFLDALEELTRICCLFGYEEQAREKFDGTAGRIRAWRTARETEQ